VVVRDLRLGGKTDDVHRPEAVRRPRIGTPGNPRCAGGARELNGRRSVRATTSRKAKIQFGLMAALYSSSPASELDRRISAGCPEQKRVPALLCCLPRAAERPLSSARVPSYNGAPPPRDLALHEASPYRIIDVMVCRLAA